MESIVSSILAATCCNVLSRISETIDCIGLESICSDVSEDVKFVSVVTSDVSSCSTAVVATISLSSAVEIDSCTDTVSTDSSCVNSNVDTVSVDSAEVIS